MKTTDPIVKLIRSTRGMQGQIGKKLGITRAAVSMWERVPPQHVLRVAKFLKMHPHVVRPDIYPPPRRPRRINDETVKQELT